MMLYPAPPAAVVLALAQPGPARARSRQQKINELVRAIGAIDMPILRKEVLPAHARKRAAGALALVGRRLRLGPEWKPGNAYWDRAAAALADDFESSLDRLGIRDKRSRAAVRKALGALTDAELDEVTRFFASNVLRKATLLTDATTAMLAWAFALLPNDVDSQMRARVDRLQHEIDSYTLTPDEEQELDDFMHSPGVQLAMRNAGARLFSGLDNPTAALETPATIETLDKVARLVEEFRDGPKGGVGG
jgi:hypothetical protein